MPESFSPTTLCVAGIDPSGGAGVTLDVGIIRSLGMHALPVVTGVALQSSDRFYGVIPAEAENIQQQLEILEGEFPLGAVKIGMLGSQGIVAVLSAWLRKRPRLPVVLDPVLRTSTGGHLAEGIRSVLIRDLLPLASVVTPNLDEASALTGLTVATRQDMEHAASALREMGSNWALITGGHLERGEAADYLAGNGETHWFSAPRLPFPNVRGTGCAFSSVLAFGLARGDSVPEAAKFAKSWVEYGIAKSYRAGKSRVLSFRR